MTEDSPSTGPDPSPDQAERQNQMLPEEAPTICLDQFLKTCGVATGGQAKRLIQGGEVLVNQQIETRRRKKLKVGDEVELFDQVFVVAFADDDEPEDPEPSEAPHEE